MSWSVKTWIAGAIGTIAVPALIAVAGPAASANANVNDQCGGTAMTVTGCNIMMMGDNAPAPSDYAPLPADNNASGRNGVGGASAPSGGGSFSGGYNSSQ